MSILRVNVPLRPLVIAVAGLVGIPGAGAFQSAAGPPVSTDQDTQVGHSTGKIQKLDIEQAAVTLKHGPIVNLGMPNMTMIFRVQHPQHLTGLNVGDRVRFEIRRVKGTLVISEIDRAQ